MKITKYEHACLVIEEQGRNLIVDPGSYSKSLPMTLNNVDGIVITHVHADHFDPKHIEALISQNATANIFCTEEVAKQLQDKSVHSVTGSSEVSVGPFKLQFFGGQHAVVHSSFPVAQNVGVLVNNKLYYPGDSFTKPDMPVNVLALPVNAPWLKISETIDFVAQIKPKIAFPTHNAYLSEAGEQLVEGILSGVLQSNGGSFKLLPVGQSLEV